MNEWMKGGDERRCASGVIHQVPWHHCCMLPDNHNPSMRYKHVKRVNCCAWLTLLVWAPWRSWTRPWFGSPPNSLRFHSAKVSAWIVYKMNASEVSSSQREDLLHGCASAWNPIRVSVRSTSSSADPDALGQLYSISPRGGNRRRRARRSERLSGGGESQPIDAPSNLRCPLVMKDLATRAQVSVIARRETGGEWRSAWVFRGGGGGGR